MEFPSGQLLYMLVSPGFEPRQAESKSAVLPLHHETFCAGEVKNDQKIFSGTVLYVLLTTRTSGLNEVLALFEFALLACVKCFYWAVIPHYTCIYCASGTLCLMLCDYLLVRLIRIILSAHNFGTSV